MLDTRIDSEAARHAVEIHRNAYNAAFYELGLKWHWGADIYQNILPHAQEKDRIRNYLETHQPHLLKAYEADFLVDMIQTVKARCYEALIASGRKNAYSIDWAEFQKIEVGV